MKRLASLLTVGILLLSSLTGCALKPIEAPVTSSFSDMVKKLPEIKIEAPVKLPKPPKTTTFSINGVDYFGFDKAGFKKLKIYSVASKANHDIASQHIHALDSQQHVQRNLIMSGKLMEQRANYLAFKWTTSETELQNEKRDHQFDNLMHRVLVIILALILI